MFSPVFVGNLDGGRVSALSGSTPKVNGVLTFGVDPDKRTTPGTIFDFL